MSPEWRAIPVSAPGLLWARYARDFGEERLRATFGAHWPPAGARHGEEVWSFREAGASPRPFDLADHPAAWLSLAVDQFDPAVCHMSRGVWPGQHGRGLGRHVRAFAEGRARALGCRHLDIEVNETNAEHLANVLMDPYWRQIAARWEPGAASVFRHDLAGAILVP